MVNTAYLLLSILDQHSNGQRPEWQTCSTRIKSPMDLGWQVLNVKQILLIQPPRSTFQHHVEARWHLSCLCRTNTLRHGESGLKPGLKQSMLYPYPLMLRDGRKQFHNPLLWPRQEVHWPCKIGPKPGAWEESGMANICSNQTQLTILKERS